MNETDLITLTSADKLLAHRRGKEKTGKRSYFTAWLIKQGKLSATIIDGVRFVKVADVMSYQPARKGRKPKSDSN